MAKNISRRKVTNKIFKALAIALCLNSLIFANLSHVSDQDLARIVNEKIGSGWFSRGYDWVNIQVTHGVVTLSGDVATMNDKEKIERKVRNIEGVKDVNNNIHVQEPILKENWYSQDMYATRIDQQLNREIRNMMRRSWVWDGYKDVFLDTNNGVVTLVGSVKNLHDQQKIMTEIQKIRGVRDVRSNLKIQFE